MDLLVYMGDNYSIYSYGGTSYCDSAKMELGGSGNVAVGLSLLGGRTVFIGKAGNDYFGKLYARNLKEKKVISKTSFDKDSSTGIAIVLINKKKERSFIVFRGANNKLSKKDIQMAFELIKKSKYIYFSGYSLVKNPQKTAILQTIMIAKQYNVKVIFDPGAYNLILSKKVFFNKLLKFCDVFTPNLDEACAITNSKNINDVIHKLRCKTPLIALKLGKDGCVLINKNNIIKVPSIKVECVDSTGAGDAFTAALIYGLAYGLPLKATGQLANWYAAQVIKHLGARGFPSQRRINNFLNKL